MRQREVDSLAGACGVHAACTGLPFECTDRSMRCTADQRVHLPDGFLHLRRLLQRARLQHALRE